VRQRNGRARLQPPAIYNPAPSVHADDDLGAYYDNKMQQSVMNFMETHPHWQPSDPSQSLFLENKLRDRPPAPHARDKRGRPVPLRVHSDGAHGAITSPRPVGLGLGLGLGPAPALSLHENRNAGPGARWFQPADLATMDERDADADADADEDADRAAASAEANALGWNTRGGDPARSASDDADPPAREDRGLLRDAGILLNQVMNR
jgi:hypothetical protein